MGILKSIIKMFTYEENEKIQPDKYKSEISPEGYQVIKHNNDIDILKNGKEFFYGQIVLESPNSQYMLVEGFKKETSGYAFVSSNNFIWFKSDEYMSFIYGDIFNSGKAIFPDEECIWYYDGIKLHNKSHYFGNIDKSNNYKITEDYCLIFEYTDNTLDLLYYDMTKNKLSHFCDDFDIDSSFTMFDFNENILNLYFENSQKLSFDLSNGIKQM